MIAYFHTSAYIVVNFLLLKQYTWDSQLTKKKRYQAWWFIPIIPALGKIKQDHYFKDSIREGLGRRKMWRRKRRKENLIWAHIFGGSVHE